MADLTFQTVSFHASEATLSYIAGPPNGLPLLLIHGELDQNPGTVPMQSEKLYEAVRGVGGTVRLVMLPFESHGYQALETTEHVLYETISWLDRHVKNAPPREKK